LELETEIGISYDPFVLKSLKIKLRKTISRLLFCMGVKLDLSD